MCVIAPTCRGVSGTVAAFKENGMSKSARYEWHDQQASLNERMKGFMENPNMEQLDAVVAEMHAYAAAARSGNIEIPARWVSCH
jgi:hypothetical protein